MKVPVFPTETIKVTGKDGDEIEVQRTRMSAQSVVSEMNKQILAADKMDECVFSTGVGIHHALTKHPISKYKDLSESEAVLASIEKGVTNGEGRGFGLWATAELIKHNKGKMQIHSGNALLQISDKIEILDAPYWQGTYTTFRLNTDIPVSDKLIFGEGSTILDSYLEELEENERAI